MKSKILFISHSADRTGAPMVLLYFLQWLKANTDLAFDVLVGDSGELLPDFRALAPTRVLDWRPSLRGRLLRKILGPDRYSQWQNMLFQRRFRGRAYDLVYANTVCNLREMALLSDLGLPVICHVHELHLSLDFFAGHDAFLKIAPRIQHFIADAKAVREYLLKDWSIPESKISLVHAFVIDRRIDVDWKRETRAITRRKLGVSENEILVGACGTLDWRKGTDLFVQVARLVRHSEGGEKIRFLWVGGKAGTADFVKFQHDVKFCGLSEAVTVIETCPNYLDYFAAMDIFALTSREDPFPLVMLDAASLELPMVCFAESGGGPEFIGEHAGLAAPYLDVSSFAEHVLTLARNPEMRRQIGAVAAQKVRSRFTVEHQAPKLLNVIREQSGLRPDGAEAKSRLKSRASTRPVS